VLLSDADVDALMFRHHHYHCCCYDTLPLPLLPLPPLQVITGVAKESIPFKVRPPKVYDQV
jgi:hypothetical protein